MTHPWCSLCGAPTRYVCTCTPESISALATAAARELRAEAVERTRRQCFELAAAGVTSADFEIPGMTGDIPF